MNLRSRVFTSFFVVALLLLFLVFARLIFTPDAGARLFERAQKFEGAGQTTLAVSHYQLLAQTQPGSAYAPRALIKAGDLLAAQGRAMGDRKTLRAAVAAYEKLATNYPRAALAGEALLDAGEICAQNLDDTAGARRFYGLLLQTSAPSSELAARATLRFGVLALDGGEAKVAQRLLQNVLQRWPKNQAIASEAQFRLGVLYETLFKNREWATRAYDATISNYPNSPFANDARGRLGLLAFSDAKNRRPARRVMIEIAPFTRDGLENSDGSLWSALPLLLAARGLEISPATLRAWSLEPFFCAVNTRDPSAVVQPSFDDFENAVANAGLKFTIKGGGGPEAAMDDLQNDLDSARLPMVFFQTENGPRWALCIGYDSSRGELFLQEGGARFQTVSVKAFAKSWEQKGPWGKKFTLLAFFSPGQKSRPRPQPTPTSAPSQAGQWLPASLQNSPSFEWQLPPLSRKAGHRNTLRRAAFLLERIPTPNYAPNISGLAWLEGALQISTVSRLTAPRRVPEPAENVRPKVMAPPLAEPTPNDVFTEEAETLARATTAPATFQTPTPSEPQRQEQPPEKASMMPAESLRARSALRFFGEASREWARKRREAASFLRTASVQLGDSNLQNAARDFEQSALDLENASVLAAQISSELSETDRDRFREIGRLVASARRAEARATSVMR